MKAAPRASACARTFSIRSMPETDFSPGQFSTTAASVIMPPGSFANTLVASLNLWQYMAAVRPAIPPPMTATSDVSGFFVIVSIGLENPFALLVVEETHIHHNLAD